MGHQGIIFKKGTLIGDGSRAVPSASTSIDCWEAADPDGEPLDHAPLDGAGEEGRLFAAGAPGDAGLRLGVGAIPALAAAGGGGGGIASEEAGDEASADLGAGAASLGGGGAGGAIGIGALGKGAAGGAPGEGDDGGS